MAITTENLIEAFEVSGLTVVDLRGRLDTHKTRSPTRRDPAKLRGLVLHHSAMEGRDLAAVRTIARYHTTPGAQNHLSRKGSPTIAYTMAVGGNGDVFLLNDLRTVTWSQGMSASQPGFRRNANTQWVSCLVLGNFRSAHNPKGREPTLQQVASTMAIATTMQRLWNWGPGFLEGHHLFGKPACPGETLARLVDAVRGERVAESPEPAPVRVSLRTHRERQEALARLGYRLTADGVWGRNSKRQLMAFQRHERLIADGLWGPRTEAAMRQALVQVGA